MNCPKCGYVQEERMDCRKCGVVFAKYYALHPPDGYASVEPIAAAELPPVVAMDPNLQELAEIRQAVHDLSRRFNELDFERIERNRLRSEVRATEQKVEELLARLTAHFADHEEQCKTFPTRRDFEDARAELLSGIIEPMGCHLTQVDQKLAAVQGELASVLDARLLEVMKRLDKRQSDLESKLAEFLSAGNGSGGSISPSQLGMALKAVDEMRTSLESVSMRYTEIGELKKNHLVLSNRLETLQGDFQATGHEAFQTIFGRISEIDREVTALRAEVRQTIGRMEALQNPPPAQQPEVQPIKEELAALNRMRSDDGEKMRSALGALESKLSESILPLSGLPEKVQALASQIQRVEQRYQPLASAMNRQSAERAPKKIAELDQTVSSLQQESRKLQSRLQSVELKLDDSSKTSGAGGEQVYRSDVHAIRENLDELRRFMMSLHEKL